MYRWFAKYAGQIIVVGLLMLVPHPGEAQVPQVTGRVLDAETGQPLSAVQMSIQGTRIGGLTNSSGVFTLSNIPEGTHTIVAQRIGYGVARQTVTIAGGAIATADFTLSQAVLSLQAVVATGLVDPVEGVRSPITVERLSRAQLPVMVGANSAVYNLQGRVAGVQMSNRSGGPGQEAQIMLRSPTSVKGNPAPLVVVDGVILGSGTANIESLDIESMEVIKGAAAASLYGSRAAAGVISITTRRGRGLAIGQTQFSIQTEIGRSVADRGGFNKHHYFLMDEAQTTYVDRNGNPVNRRNRVAPPASLAFSDNRYPAETYDNFGAMFAGGAFETQSFSMSQNLESTNFALNVSRMRESGPLQENDGYNRNSFRLNLDHRFLDTFTLGVSTYHSRDNLDNPKVDWTQLLLAPPDIDVTQKDEDGNFIRVPDVNVAYENPLWREASREDERSRARTLASASLRWNPLDFLTFASNVSYDREDTSVRRYLPKGTPISITSVVPSDGQIDLENGLTDTWNGELQMSLRRDFGPLNVRTTARGLIERASAVRSTAAGSNFYVQGVPRIDAAATKNASSLDETVRALGYLWDTAFDYSGKYILTVLGRRDGSSLFGPDNRWHNYYRLAGAWRIAEEPWFNIPQVDELKLSYARGTAGGRPLFAYQYETWSVGPSGVTKATLGNRLLRPEHTTEQEVSLEIIVASRFSIDLARAWQRTTDQIVDAALSAFTGYTAQWQNGGVVTGNTWEATLEAQLIQRQNFSWTSTFTFDRSAGQIEEWPFAGQLPGHRNWQTGESIWGIHGAIYANNPNILCVDTWQPDNEKGYGGPHHSGAACNRKDEFMLNDEGWLVWVGQGNRYTDGIAKGLWGTSTAINGIVYEWGIPFVWRNARGANRREQFWDNVYNNFGSANTFQIGALSLHAHLHANLGGMTVDGYHRGHVDFHPRQDMFGAAGERPDELKKPARHWWALAGGGGMMHAERTDFLKLRTLSAHYRLGQEQLSRIGLGRVGFDNVSIGLIGRNLINVTNCICPDGESGLDFNDRAGSAVRGYPSTKSFTAEIGLTF